MVDQTYVILSIVFKNGKGENKNRHESITMTQSEFDKIWDNEELMEKMDKRYRYAITWVYPHHVTKAEEVINCYLK